MRTTTAAVAGLLLVLGSTPTLALDCARVEALKREGKRPSDIARELGITTPDVQACLAGVVEQPVANGAPARRLPLAPSLPGADTGPIRRGPNQQ